jgi:hypothetical protein
MFDIYSHNYSFAVIGLSKKYNKSFSTRSAANEYMYKLCHKFGLTIEETYNDNHDKTYLCTKGVTFYIQRA